MSLAHFDWGFFFGFAVHFGRGRRARAPQSLRRAGVRATSRVAIPSIRGVCGMSFVVIRLLHGRRRVLVGPLIPAGNQAKTHLQEE